MPDYIIDTITTKNQITNALLEHRDLIVRATLIPFRKSRDDIFRFAFLLRLKDNHQGLLTTPYNVSSPKAEWDSVYFFSHIKDLGLLDHLYAINRPLTINDITQIECDPSVEMKLARNWSSLLISMSNEKPLNAWDRYIFNAPKEPAHGQQA